jgi:hypothetical protein
LIVSSAEAYCNSIGPWYCAIRHSGGNIVLKKTYSLAEAQASLGTASSSQQQAIIPMSGANITACGLTSLGGDPHTLAKTWNGGSMYWYGCAEINSMRTKCAAESPPYVSSATAAPTSTPYLGGWPDRYHVNMIGTSPEWKCVIKTQPPTSSPTLTPTDVPTTLTPTTTDVPSFVPTETPSEPPTAVPSVATPAPTGRPSASPAAVWVVSTKGRDLKPGEWTGYKNMTASQCAAKAVAANVFYFAYSSVVYGGFCKVLNPDVSNPDLSTYQGYEYRLYDRSGTRLPTRVPTRFPTLLPTVPSTRTPTEAPTASPTHTPTHVPTTLPPTTDEPSFAPTRTPTDQPTLDPTLVPTEVPTPTPSEAPTPGPTPMLTRVPTTVPTPTFF